MNRFLLTGIYVFWGWVWAVASEKGEAEWYGRVSSAGKGIAGVAVTDGYRLTATDARGNYRLSGCEAAGFVYITLPAGYKVTTKNGDSGFYRPVVFEKGRRQRVDFELEKEEGPVEEYALLVCADPQVYFEEELPVLRQAVEDMRQWAGEMYAGKPVYGLVCGDIVGDIRTKPGFFGPVKEIFRASGFPFFYAAGNHDADLGIRSNETSKTTYGRHFGPAWYSFNRGKIHYVVLDDVFCTGKDYAYTGYVEERQLRWLEQDLALVPENSTVIVTAHIPLYSREARNGNPAREKVSQAISNREHLLDLLKPYRVHFMSGHTHYQENYVLGDRFFEHVHASLCGLFWQAPWCGDGTPRGYAVYEIEGDEITRWYFKPVGKDREYQFRVYPPGSDPGKPEAITVNVWNYDPAWRICWYENGVKQGDMEQYTGYDARISEYVSANRKNFRYSYIGAEPTEHMFYAVPQSADSRIRIEVTDRFGEVYIWEGRAGK